MSRARIKEVISFRTREMQAEEASGRARSRCEIDTPLAPLQRDGQIKHFPLW